MAQRMVSLSWSAPIRHDIHASAPSRHMGVGSVTAFASLAQGGTMGASCLCTNACRLQRRTAHSLFLVSCWVSSQACPLQSHSGASQVSYWLCAYMLCSRQCAKTTLKCIAYMHNRNTCNLALESFMCFIRLVALLQLPLSRLL